jgi:hypothetical protein
MAPGRPVRIEAFRPDEPVDLAAALHGLPGKPGILTRKVVIGHAGTRGC